ncbi:PQQ-dependent sugar dehydrogenase [Novosphingobium album (ex Liu et al. 2023)]|uniref:PQQ-dependent sugar dehydrogenase n=1 Tax=Novosphingobium album (ex Liu et al. 2023) TaxID=3031130 RepID=A0ABT5WW42_9SPHN|nr:PQQ-dependent sugar dehydrogenase [Novosphingobium album (ex Liu et al. 2023)]MDE8654074.1 PQQ-dependent sugar dehydrogenase [Novosphingobium album (ex Liu et al. 2023)]
MTIFRILTLVSPLPIALASCGAAAPGDKAAPQDAAAPFRAEPVARFEAPWAMDIDRDTGVMLVTERAGALKLVTPDGKISDVAGVPKVDFGGQGGLGDVRLAPGQTGTTFDRRTIYLSWAEAGEGDTRGAALGRGTIACDRAMACALQDLKVIWRQQPKVTGRGHYSHRIAFSPDGQYLFVSSGERQKMAPAQDLSNTLGTIVRLLPDGTPAPGNPFAARGAPGDQIWSYGHRNVLGLALDPQGRLWGLEHGPKGGDELNLIEPGRNYGWPLVSDGDHYDGTQIPRHATRPDLAGPAISWNPVIAPGDFIFYTGDDFPEWRGEAVIAAMKPAALVRVAITGNGAREVARYPMPHRIREIEQGPNGTLWLLEDGQESATGRLLRLIPATR